MSTTDPALSISFVGLRARLRPMVWRIVERGRLEDPEAVEAEVWLRVWRAYPRMVRREEQLRARGLPGHRWRPWVSRVAKRLVLDEQRRREVWRRLHGVRAFAARDVTIGGPAADEREWDRLLDVDACADPAALNDPSAYIERAWELATLAHGMRHLPPLEAAVVRRWGNGERLNAIARDLGMSLYATRRTQRAGLARLRRVFGLNV